MSIADEAEKNMQAAIEHLKIELKNIRTGHANVGMLDPVQVEVYGAKMRLRDVANVTAPEARQLLITPYDPSAAAAIAKGIEAANLGFQVIHDGNVVRINIPPMDEAMRKEMAKQCKGKAEEAKISVRNARRDANETVKKQKADGDIPEDLMKKIEKDVQALTDKYCKDADELCKVKEQEVMAV